MRFVHGEAEHASLPVSRERWRGRHVNLHVIQYNDALNPLPGVKIATSKLHVVVLAVYASIVRSMRTSN